MTTTTALLLLSMSEIAALAKVRRPVVTMWRARAAASDLPFPAPVNDAGSPLLFDSDQIVRWLDETGRGNNASADRDAAAHARAPEGATFDSVSALLALRASTGRSLATLSAADLFDLADAADPDDESTFSEIDALARPEALARYADELADAAYGDAAAYERMLAAERRRSGSKSAGALLTDDGVQLLARVVQALDSATTESAGASQVELVDSTGAALDVIVERAKYENVADMLVRLGPKSGELVESAESAESVATLRQARRRLVAHGIPRAENAESPSDEVPAVRDIKRHLHLLVVGAADATAASLLSSVDDLAMQLDGSQLALVVAPSAALSNAGLDREAAQLRSGVLRSGQVRAIVRLPAGLRAGMPRQSLTLWVMGAAHPDVDLADRWTMVADLSTTRRNAQFDSDLIGDLAASLGSHSAVRAHAFRFARLVFTRTLLARRGSLMIAAPTNHDGHHPASAADVSVKVEKLLTELRWPADAVSVTPVPSAEPQAQPRIATIDKLIAAGQVRYLAGNRLDLNLIDTAPASPGRIPVIGIEELTGETQVGSRSIGRSSFVTEQPSGRFTEPGDVVFCTSPRPRAIVDHDGLSVVLYPARILRIRPDGDDELLPDVIAGDINARRASDTSWRSWPTRRVDPRQRADLASTLDSLRTDRAATLRRLAQLDELESTLVDGVARGDLTLTATLLNESAPPSKGTP